MNSTSAKILGKIKRKLIENRFIVLRHAKKSPDAWLTKNLSSFLFTPPVCPEKKAITDQLTRTDELGKQPLWEGYLQLKQYERTDMERLAHEVSTFGILGDFFAWLTIAFQPNLIVEFGTAFGASGMFWIAGLKQQKKGKLFTFEPNEIWAKLAHENLKAIDSSEAFFDLTMGTFEDNLNRLPADQKIDLAFIDAIHTSEFVIPQFDLVYSRSHAGSLIILDDIDFSEDMKSCWETVVKDPRVKAAVNLGRMGIVEI